MASKGLMQHLYQMLSKWPIFLIILVKKNKKRDNRPLKTHEILSWSKVLHGGQNHRHEKIVFLFNFTLHLTPPD